MQRRAVSACSGSGVAVQGIRILRGRSRDRGGPSWTRVDPGSVLKYVAGLTRELGLAARRNKRRKATHLPSRGRWRPAERLDRAARSSPSGKEENLAGLYLGGLV
jgi:hypothetical protein